MLEDQTYIQRTADVYEYLTDEEKDVEDEIKGTEVDKDSISAELSKLIFDGIIKNTKIRYGEDGRDYNFSRKLDGKLYSREQELAINVISPLNDNDELFNDNQIKMLSIQNDRDLIVALEPDSKLRMDIIIYKKTEKYINENRNMQQQESIKKILNDRATQNIERYTRIQQAVAELVSKAKFYISGSEVEISGEHPQSRIIKAFQLLKEKLKEVEILLAKESEFKFLNVLEPVKEKLKNCCGKTYSWYLTDFRECSDELLDLKENIINPISQFVSGTGGEIYKNAVKFINEQRENFQYLDYADVQEVQHILEDANCFKGTTIQILRDEFLLL